MIPQELPQEQLDLAISRVPLIAEHLARRLPSGINRDDLESAGNLAVTQAMRTFDPALGFEFLNYAARAARNAMANEMARQRQRNRNREPMEIRGSDDPEGRALVRVDPKAGDPAEIAEVREMVRKRKRRSLVLTQVRAGSPEVAEIAAKAQQLRAAAFAAVGEQDMADVMKMIVANAKSGHVGSARLLLDYVGSGRGQGASVQQAIILPAQDVEEVI